MNIQYRSLFGLNFTCEDRVTIIVFILIKTASFDTFKRWVSMECENKVIYHNVNKTELLYTKAVGTTRVATRIFNTMRDT